MGEFEHRIDMSPGHDWTTTGNKDYGIGAVRIWFYVIGPKGAVQWQISTDWYPAAARERLHNVFHWPSEYDRRDAMKPKAYDLGYHSPTPRYDGQTLMSSKCDVLGAECYYDGSSLNAEPLVEPFIRGGTKWLWPKLEAYYRCVFEDAPYPEWDDGQGSDPTAFPTRD